MRHLFVSLGAALALAAAPVYAQQTPQMQPKGLTPHQQAQLQQLAAYAKKEHLKPICEYVKKNPTGMMKTFDGQTVYFHVFPDVFGTTTVECGQHFAVKSFQGTHSIFLYDVQKDGSVDVSVYVDRDVDPVHVPIIDREALVPGVLEAAIAADHRHPVGDGFDSRTVEFRSGATLQRYVFGSGYTQPLVGRDELSRQRVYINDLLMTKIKIGQAELDAEAKKLERTLDQFK